MDRVRQGTGAVARITLSLDEVPTDPDGQTVLVTARRLSGVTVFADVAATNVAAGIYEVALSAANTALLDTLTLTWAYARETEAMFETTEVEVVGGFLCQLADLRRRLSSDDYSTGDLLSARTAAEQAIEDAAGVAFVPRYTRDRMFMRSPSWRLQLDRSRVRRVRDMTIAGVTADDQTLGQVVLDADGDVAFSTALGGFWYGTVSSLWGQEVYVGYEHGYDSPPRPVVDAALDAAVYYAQNDRRTAQAPSTGIDPRATRIVTQDGTIELGGAGGVQGLPSVENVVCLYGMPGIA